MGRTDIPSMPRAEATFPGLNTLETAAALSTEQFVGFQKASPEFNMLDRLKDVVRLFEGEGIRHALIGGLAVGHHAIPRATKDVDVLVEEADVEKVRRLLPAYYQEGSADFQRYEIRGVRLDVVTARLRFQRSALDDAGAAKIDGVSVRVVAVRDLILLKFVAAGQRKDPAAALQDQADIAALIREKPSLTPADFSRLADVVRLNFRFTRESAARYDELIRWLNDTLTKLGRADCVLSGG